VEAAKEKKLLSKSMTFNRTLLLLKRLLLLAAEMTWLVCRERDQPAKRAAEPPASPCRHRFAPFPGPMFRESNPSTPETPKAEFVMTIGNRGLIAFAPGLNSNVHRFR